MCLSSVGIYAARLDVAIYCCLALGLLVGTMFLVRRSLAAVLARIDDLAQPEWIPVPLLCLRIQADEPGFILQTLVSLASIPAALDEAIVKPITLWGSIAAFGLAFAALFAYSALRLFSGLSALCDLSMYICLGAAIAGMTLLLVQFLWSILCSLVFNFAMAHPGGLGVDGWTRGWILRVRVSTEPNDARVEIRQFRLGDVRKRLGKNRRWMALRHSVLFQHPDALNEIADFLKLHCRLESTLKPRDG